MSELEDAIERLELWARGEEFDELTVVIAAARERDALAAVIEAIRRNWRTQKPELFHGVTRQIIDRTPSDVLAEHDARVRAEVIDWIAGRIRSIPHWWDAEAGYGEFDLEPLGPHRTSEQGAYMEVSQAVDDAREHFGLTKGAERG